MSDSDRYFTAPLSILRSSNTPLEALHNVVSCGIVNAGIGYRKDKGEDEFQILLEQANDEAEKKGVAYSPPHNLKLQDSGGMQMLKVRAVELWEAAHAGAKLCGVTGGSRADDARIWATHRHEGAVFFRIKSERVWNAINTAKREAGENVESDSKPLSWREFRILAAILSAPVHPKRGFVFLGWESIQARSCGFHRKDLFDAGENTLPLHCQPFTRSQIDLTTSRMEANKFYLRFRYSKGDRGGKTAYSFRHDSREKLAAAVGEYQSHYCIQQTMEANRSRDRELSALMQATSKRPAT